MTTASLNGPTLKLERAQKHLRELEVAIQGFFDSNPYEVRVEDNAETRKREHRVARAEAIPDSLTIITGDVIHNLRSALDHLVWQLVIANGGNPKDMRTAFPVWKSQAAFESGQPGDAAGLSEAALDLLYTLKPYQGGNDALWLLHKLDIVDKHRLVLAVAAAHQSVIIDAAALIRQAWAEKGLTERAAEIPAAPLEINPADRQTIKFGTVLMEGPLGDKSHDDVEFRIEIALNEPEVRQGESLLPTLHRLFRFVGEAFDACSTLFN